MREKGSMISEFKPWGRWATLGLGLIALFGGQIVALIVLIRWFGFSLPRWSDLVTDGVLVTRECLHSNHGPGCTLGAHGVADGCRRYRLSWSHRAA